jgi:hypothetical protein
MAPKWLCLECEGIAYGWAHGPCPYCDSPQLVGTEEAYHLEDPPTDYRLIFYPQKQWRTIEAEATLAAKSPRELLVQHERAPVVRILNEPLNDGRLVLFERQPSNHDAGIGHLSESGNEC